MLFDKSIVIHAPPEVVFGWLAPHRMPAWDHSLVRAVPRVSGALAQGAHFERVSREFGCRFEMDAEAVAIQDGRVFAWRQFQGDFEQHRGAYLLDRLPDGSTRVRLVEEVDPPYVLPRIVTEAEVRRTFSAQVDDALFNLKAIAERGAS